MIAAAAKERAERFMAKRKPYVADVEKFTEHLADELQQYGDERAAEAREAAIEEAIGFIANEHFLVIAGLRRHFALAAKPGSAG